VLNITDRQTEYAQGIADFFKKQGFRVESDLRNEKIGFKIREHTIQRVPYLLVTGDKEAESGTVAVRTREGKDMGQFSLEKLASVFASENAGRGRTHLED
jgi:threonyl-tRNA synthetase